jgi:hypothetical protein
MQSTSQRDVCAQQIHVTQHHYDAGTRKSMVLLEDKLKSIIFGYNAFNRIAYSIFSIFFVLCYWKNRKSIYIPGCTVIRTLISFTLFVVIQFVNKLHIFTQAQAS